MSFTSWTNERALFHGPSPKNGLNYKCKPPLIITSRKVVSPPWSTPNACPCTLDSQTLLRIDFVLIQYNLSSTAQDNFRKKMMQNMYKEERVWQRHKFRAWELWNFDNMWVERSCRTIEDLSMLETERSNKANQKISASKAGNPKFKTLHKIIQDPPRRGFKLNRESKFELLCSQTSISLTLKRPTFQKYSENQAPRARAWLGV